MSKKKKYDRKLANNSDDLAHMSFYAPSELKNAFKAKTAIEGKSITEVLVSLMESYVKNK